MKAAIYVRVSTEEQVKEGYSLDAQEDRLRAYCISQEWEVVKVYRDEGKSAKDLERPELQKLLRDMKSGLVDVVLVYRLDRLTRSVLDLYKLLEEFEKYEVKFKSATEVYDTTTAIGRLFITLVAALAQWERENLAERVKMGMAKMVALGKWSGGTSPYGYEYKNGCFHIIHHEAELVKKMFKMARTKGMDGIAKNLNKDGYRTRKGTEFHGFTVQYIVRNPFYIGKMRFNDERFQIRKSLDEQQLYDSDLIEPIIDEDEFWDLQKILDKRKDKKGKGRTGGFYFTSILKCGKCGRAMTGTSNKIGNKHVKFYRCQGKVKGSLCNMPNIKEDNLVKEIVGNFEQYVWGILQPKKVEEKQDDNTADIEAELKNIAKQTEKYKLMFVNDLIDIDELNGKIHQLRQREKELKMELNKEDDSGKNMNTDDINGLVESFPQLWEISTDEERKLLLASIFDEIVVDALESAKVAPGNSKPFWFVSVK